MFGKSAQMFVGLIALVFLIGTVGTAAAQPQSMASYHVFGITVENIYDRGVMVTEVDLGSRAQQIGFKKDDVILAINGEPVMGTYQFQRIVEDLDGGPLTLTVSRVGQINTFTIYPR